MRTLEQIDGDLARAREALSRAEGSPAEVYSRIVGYYRSVRNWNRGKREEYGERKLFAVPGSPAPADGASVLFSGETGESGISGSETRLVLFVQKSCPKCPGAKAEAGKLGIPVDLVDAGTEDGMAEAARRQVFSTPTAILLAGDGHEMGRALDAAGIGAFAAL